MHIRVCAPSTHYSGSKGNMVADGMREGGRKSIVWGRSCARGDLEIRLEKGPGSETWETRQGKQVRDLSAHGSPWVVQPRLRHTCQSLSAAEWSGYASLTSGQGSSGVLAGDVQNIDWSA